jgi:outer membrane protein TolC
MKLSKLAIACILFFALSELWAQDTTSNPVPVAANTASIGTSAPTGQKTLSLQETIDVALSKGDSNAILQKNLDISRAQYKQIVADNSFSLSAALGDTAYDGFGNTSLLDNYEAVSPYSPAAVAAGYNSFSSYVTSLDQLGLGLVNRVPTYPNMSGNIIPQSIAGSLSFKGPSTTLSLIGDQYLTIANSPYGLSQSVIGASLSQTVWDGYPGGIPKATVQKGLYNLQSTELSSDSNRLTLIYQVKQAYYTMLNAQRSLDNYKGNLERQKSALDQEQTLYDMQQAAAVDLQTAKINYKSAQIDLENGQITLDIDRKTLANLVGIPAETEFTLAEAEDPQIPAKSLGEAISIGLDKRIELKQVALNRKIADISLGLVKAQTSSTVTVNGGGYMFMDNDAGTNAQAVSLGVKVGLPILDSGSAAYQAEATRYQQEVYDIQDGQYRRSISLDIENAYKQVQLEQDKYELAKLTASNSVDQYELLKVERQYGTATNQDVLTATVTMVNARTAAFTARNSLDLAILQLQNVMGM